MYNLTVDTAHTFFVGEGQWLVHNDSCDPVLGALANTANNAFQQLKKNVPGLESTTVAASMGKNNKLVLALYNEIQEGTVAAVKYLQNKGWNVLDAPIGRGPDFHAERQLYNAGHTKIGISRQKGLCPPCARFFENLPHVKILPYKP